MSRRPLGPWLFGKLPAHGDFVARGLDLDLRDGLDAWLAAGIAQARQRWGENEFDARYFAAPPWRFVDADPDGAMSAGAVCLSVDAVGRKFPFLLAAPVADAGAADAAGLACVELAYNAVAEGWEADRVRGELPAEPAGEAGEGAKPCWLLDTPDGPLARIAGRFPDRLIEAMLEHAQ